MLYIVLVPVIFKKDVENLDIEKNTEKCPQRNLGT